MIDIGRYKGKLVSINTQELENQHIAVIGMSGSGKSVECQRIISSIVQQGGTVIAFDIHHTLSNDQIFWKYKPIFDEHIFEIEAHRKGIPCPLFTPVTYPDGTEEEAVDLIGSLTDVLAGALHIGSTQKTELRKALWYVYEAGEYETEGFAAVDKALKNVGNKAAAEVREKLYFLTMHNIFRPGGELFHPGKINIFRLSRFSLQMQVAVTELILAYLWRFANSEQLKGSELYLFIDEFQNLPSGKDSALAQMLSEGRKLGVNLILASQMILQGTTSAVQQRIAQCGLMLYFRPAANRVGLTAKMLDGASDSDWVRLLRTLQIGEFIASGSFMVDGVPKKGNLKVSAVEKRENSPEQEKYGASGSRGTVLNIIEEESECY